MVNGDLVPNGWEAEYDRFLAVLADHPHPSTVLTSMGNHEQKTGEPFPTTRDRYLRRTGMPGVFDERRIGGLPILVIGTTEAGSAGASPVTLGARQRAWPAEALRRHSGERHVLVFSHHVLPDSVSGSTGADSASFDDRDFADGDGLLEILGRHPNVVFFSGHTHWSLARDGWKATKVVVVDTLYGPAPGREEKALDLRIEARDLRTGTVFNSLER